MRRLHSSYYMQIALGFMALAVLGKIVVLIMGIT